MFQTFKRFISFEGIDYCGKSTQIELLQKRLNELGIIPVVLREPGGTVISEKIRELLLDPSHSEMHERTEILLYEAARAQLVHEKIIPLLEAEKFVIADRFFDSTTCYQGYGRGLELEFVQKLNCFATGGLQPFKTFFIDISPEEARVRQIRSGASTDRMESAGLEFFSKIRQGFIQLCKKYPERFVRIDGGRDPEVVAGDVWEVLSTIWELSE